MRDVFSVESYTRDYIDFNLLHLGACDLTSPDSSLLLMWEYCHSTMVLFVVSSIPLIPMVRGE